MMLVKHKEKLEMLKESEIDVAMPELDQQKLEEMNRILQQALEEKK